MIVISIFSKNNKENYLDYIPIKNKQFTYNKENGIAIIQIDHTGIYDKLAQKFFKRPKTSYVTLDSISSYVWINIDGKRTINDIAILLKNEYREKAEPLYDRIVQFFKILSQNKYISFKK